MLTCPSPVIFVVSATGDLKKVLHSLHSSVTGSASQGETLRTGDDVYSVKLLISALYDGCGDLELFELKDVVKLDVH